MLKKLSLTLLTILLGFGLGGYFFVASPVSANCIGTDNFPTALTNFSALSCITSRWLNSIETTIGITGSTNPATLTWQINHLNLTSNASGTLPVSNGGTGVTTIPANGVLIGNGTSPITTVAPGTVNNFLLSDGTHWTSGTLNGVGFSFGGDGSDGVVTQNTSTTLVRDMYYATLNVSTGTVINTNGYRIFVSNSLLVNGTIRNNGNPGGNGATSTGITGGAGGAGGLAISNTGDLFTNYATGGVGGKGGDGRNTTGNGNGGNAGLVGSSTTVSVGSTATSSSAGGTGGTDGVRAGGAGGPGGASGSISTTTDTVLRNPIKAYFFQAATGTQLQAYPSSGGGGGGGGGEDNLNSDSPVSGGGGGGGGSGSPAGGILIYAKTITIGTNGLIQAIGGGGGVGGGGAAGTGCTAGNASGGGGGAGGSGGNGGVIVLIYSSITNNGSISVAGGTGGLGGGGGGFCGAAGAGVSGNPGNSGNPGFIIQFSTPQ